MPVMCKSMVRYEQNALTAGTLSLPQFWVMSWLMDHRAATMHELSSAMKMKPSTATMQVDRLVRMKLLSRRREDKDRRKVHVALTRTGSQMIREIYQQKKMALRETFRHLNARERRLYIDLIETLAGRLENSQGNIVQQG